MAPIIGRSMNVGHLAERELSRETKVLRENPPQYNFMQHKSYTTWGGIKPGRRGGKPASSNLKFDRPKEIGLLGREFWRRFLH
jgi:hypothetical protein